MKVQTGRQTSTTASSRYTATKAERCPRCGDRGIYLKRKSDGSWWGVRCDCTALKKTMQLIESSGLTAQQRAVKLADFRPQAATAPMYALVKNYLRDFKQIRVSGDEAKGLGLMGTVGIGKTHLLLAAANELLKSGVPVIFVSTPELIAELYDAQFAPGLQQGLNARIAALGQAPVVIFDDVGKERITDWVRNQYYRIINRRYIRRLPTLFSSNLNFSAIAEKIGDASASRLFSLTRGRQVYVQARDYRIKKGG